MGFLLQKVKLHNYNALASSQKFNPGKITLYTVL